MEGQEWAQQAPQAARTVRAQHPAVCNQLLPHVYSSVMSLGVWGDEPQAPSPRSREAAPLSNRVNQRLDALPCRARGAGSASTEGEVRPLVEVHRWQAASQDRSRSRIRASSHTLVARQPAIQAMPRPHPSIRKLIKRTGQGVAGHVTDLLQILVSQVARALRVKEAAGGHQAVGAGACRGGGRSACGRGQGCGRRAREEGGLKLPTSRQE